MLRFAVYDQHGLATRCPVDRAYVVGPDDLPLKGTVGFENGHVVCISRTGQALGVCLQFQTDGQGMLMLQTCLLPPREKPYILTVELARHRIKTFIAKSEEWQMFDLGADHPAMQEWERAREVFTRAIIAPEPQAANALAREALSYAIKATERLALAHAEILLRRRFAHRPASSTTLGVGIWPDRDTGPLREIVDRDFDVVMVPLRWNQLEVEEGQYRWGPTDRWIEWAQKQGKPVVAGPLLDFSARFVPRWLYVWQHDYDTCRDLAYDHVTRVVQRYGSAVNMWNVASGINLNDNFTFTPDQMYDLVRMGVLAVRQTSRRARTMVEIAQPFGEACARHKNAIAATAFMDRMVQEGIKTHALGVQLLFGDVGGGALVRDLMQISSVLDRFFLLELPVIVSAMGVPSEPTDPAAGSWHGAWSPELQAAWASRVFMIAMSKPFVETVFWGDLYDHEHALPAHAGLITAAGKPKPALDRLIRLRKRLRKPLGPLVTDAIDPVARP